MNTQNKSNTRGFRFIIIAVAVFASLVTAFSGNYRSLPLESHEVFVARTAEEMIAGNSWIIPYLNNEPRLKKPPLSYWLVMAIDRINGADGIVTEFEARLPSAISGVLMAVMACMLGVLLFDNRVGMLAGLLLASSAGFVSYTHSARPEMLYAMLCTAGILGLVVAGIKIRDGENSKARWASYGAWIAFGLAILAKGPQLPLLIVIGFVIGLCVTGRRGDAFKIIRPFMGLLIAVILSLWWYGAVMMLLPNAMEVWRHETVDRVLDSSKSWMEYLNPYYLYRSGGLVLPWVALYPFFLLAPWTREFKKDHNSKILWWVVILSMIGLSISINRRWYYILPVLVPLCVLISAWLIHAIDLRTVENKNRWLRGFLAAHVVGFCVAAVWIWKADTGESPQFQLPGIIVVVISTISALIIVLRTKLTDSRSAYHIAIATSIAGVVFMASSAAYGSFWREKRLHERAFSDEIMQHVAADDPIFGWHENWVVVQYYLHRNIPTIIHYEEIVRLLEDRESIWLLVSEQKTLVDTQRFKAEQIINHERSKDDTAIQLWRVSR